MVSKIPKGGVEFLSEPSVEAPMKSISCLGIFQINEASTPLLHATMPPPPNEKKKKTHHPCIHIHQGEIGNHINDLNSKISKMWLHYITSAWKTHFCSKLLTSPWFVWENLFGNSETPNPARFEAQGSRAATRIPLIRVLGRSCSVGCNALDISNGVDWKSLTERC